MASGIWCSGKMSQYQDGYASETLHGRSVPFATGVKLANPDMTVIAYGGDGDGYGIGLGHLLHAARRNTNILYIVADNENYALTTGQASPTTPVDIKTRSTPEGNHTRPFDPLKLVEAAGCSYNITIADKDIKGLTEAIKNGILHPGFAHINVQQVCPTWRKW